MQVEPGGQSRGHFIGTAEMDGRVGLLELSPRSRTESHMILPTRTLRFPTGHKPHEKSPCTPSLAPLNFRSCTACSLCKNELIFLGPSACVTQHT